MRFKQLAICTLALTCSFYFPVIGYAASPYLNFGDRDGTVGINLNGEGSTYSWTSIASESIAAWNTSKARVTINKKSTSKNKMVVTDFSDSWYGKTDVSLTSDGYIAQFTINVNGKSIVSNAKNVHNFIKSTITHEFGHVFWLCDNPAGSSSIMHHSRDRNNMTEPQAYDIKNVNAKYK